MNAVSTATVDITVQIALDSIWDAIVCERKQAFVGEELRAMPLNDVKCVAATLEKGSKGG